MGYIRWTDCKSCDGSVTQSQTPSTYLYAAPKRPPKTCQKETEKEEGDALAPRPPHPQANPHPPMPRNQHLLSSLPRLPVCHHPQRNSPHPTYKVMSETVRDCGSAPPMSSPIAIPSLIRLRPPHTHVCCEGGMWTNEYILCMLPKTACLQRYNYKKARVQRTFYPISLYK